MPPSPRLEFEQTVDGFFRGALEAHRDPVLLQLLKADGLDLSGKLEPAYPGESFYRWVRLAAKHRYPALPPREAHKKLGALAVERGLNSTVIGRAVLVMMKTLGVRRSLLRIGFSLKSGNNYIAAEAMELGKTSVEVRFNTLMDTPGYFEGVLEAGAVILGGKDVRVTRTDPGVGEAASYRVDWRD